MEKTKNKNNFLTSILFGLIGICILLIAIQVGNNVIVELQADNLKETYAVNRELILDEEEIIESEILATPTVSSTQIVNEEDQVLDDPYFDTGE